MTGPSWSAKHASYPIVWPAQSSSHCALFSPILTVFILRQPCNSSIGSWVSECYFRYFFAGFSCKLFKRKQRNCSLGSAILRLWCLPLSFLPELSMKEWINFKVYEAVMKLPSFSKNKSMEIVLSFEMVSRRWSDQNNFSIWNILVSLKLKMDHMTDPHGSSPQLLG